jgi:hypothetical protein
VSLFEVFRFVFFRFVFFRFVFFLPRATCRFSNLFVCVFARTRVFVCVYVSCKCVFVCVYRVNVCLYVYMCRVNCRFSLFYLVCMHVCVCIVCVSVCVCVDVWRGVSILVSIFYYLYQCMHM